MLLYSIGTTVSVAQQPPSYVHSEHGTVVAVYTPPTSTGLVRGSYRVNTSTRVYEFAVRGEIPELVVGQAIDFRVQGDSVYLIASDGEEHRFRLLKVEQRPGGSSSNPDGTRNHMAASSPQTWDVKLGLAVLNKPTYLGSDRDVVTIGPPGSIVWHDTVSVDAEGLKVYWHQDNVRIGVGLTYDLGRKDSDQNGFFSSGDDRLKGMDEISPSAGFDVFTSDRVGPFAVTLSATRFDGKENKGTLANLDVGAPLQLTSQLTIFPHVSAVWANRNYMETFFGVTPTEASDSMFHQFTSDEGLRNLGGGVDVAYGFNEHWRVGGKLIVTRFEGDAAQSPLTLSDISTQLILGFIHHF